MDTPTRIHGMEELLEAEGFRVRGRRADCAHCEGESRLTVSFNERFAFCHRCQWRTSLQRLAKLQSRSIPARKVGRASIRKASFRQWLRTTYSQMADQERRLARRATWARTGLDFYPDHEAGWSALASWYDRERSFQLFFEAAQDKLGRHALYRSWRRANG